LKDSYRKSSCLVEITNQSWDDHEFAHMLSHFTVFSVAERRRSPLGRDIHVMLALRRSSRQIVVTDEELDGPDMVGELLEKGQHVADQPCNVLPQCDEGVSELWIAC
jgi:hypothetical protein